MQAPADTPPDDEQYRLRGRVEIAHLLRTLQKGATPLTVILGGGRDFIVSSVLDADAAAGLLVLDAGSTTELNERLLREGSALVAASPDGVPVRFEVRDIRAAQHDGRLTLRMPFPAEVTKLQRRQAYRIRLPDPSRVSCDLQVDGTSLTGVDVSDLSVTGLCLGGLPVLPGLQPGAHLHGCVLRLPGESAVTVNLRLRHRRSGADDAPAAWGAEFTGLGGDAEALLQRFLIRAQRESRRRDGDLS